MKKSLKTIISVCLVLMMALQMLVLPVMASTLDEEDLSKLFPELDLKDNGIYQVSGLTPNQYQQALSAKDLGMYESTDRVNAIVMLGKESILSLAQKAGVSVAEYAASDAGKAKIAEMTAAQDEAIRRLGSDIADVNHRYTTLFSGFSCTTEYGNLAKIESMFKGSTTLIGERYIPDAQQATDNALNAYETGIYNSSEAGYTGKGMLVAVLDTGLDYNHVAFQRLPEGEVKLTADDVEELFPLLAASKLNDASARWEECYYSDKVVFMYDYADKDPDVYPVNDHGTHVAGIISGKDDKICGVAVDSQLAIFKVFGNKDQGAETEDILAALSDAVLLGVDVINMSLGSSCGFSRAEDDEGVNEVYDAVRAAGINLIVAASNSHSSGKGSNAGDTNLTSNPDSMTIGSPATYDSSLAVASVLGAKTHYLLANGEQPIYLIKAKNNHGDDIEFYEQMLNGRQTAEFEYVLVPGVGNEGNYANIDVKGKIAVIKRGVTTFEEKVQTAEAMGAIGAIIYNNVSGTISMTIGIAKLPACSISMDAGAYFVEHPTGKLNLSADNLAGPFMSDFSSWGPNGDLVLNPDLTSYGGDITSAVRGGYDVYSGTSMACPNLAGSAALVRQYVKETHPEFSADEVMTLVNQLLMSTSSILRNEAGNPYSPRKQGAGLADAVRAIRTGAYLLVEGSDKTKLSLGDDAEKTGKYTLKFILRNTTSRTLSYDLTTYVMTETVSTDGKTVAEQAYMLSSDIRYSVTNGGLVGNTVSVLGYNDAEITVEITLSEADRTYLETNFKNGMYVEGFTTLTSRDNDADLTIPYLAFFGDWTKAPLLDVTAFEEGKEAKDPSILEDEKLKADVYASIPMVGFYSGKEISYYYMCKPAFTLAKGYEAPATLEEYCALTTSTDGNFMIKFISAGLLRNAKTAHMTITDPVTGKVIFERTTENCRKSHYNGNQTGGYVEVEFDASKAGLANNTKYVFNMTCELEWEGEQNNLKNEYSFTFYIDDEAPVVDLNQTNLRVERDKEGNVERYLLDLYVYDNRFLSGYFISTFDKKDANGNAVEPEAVIDGFIPVDDMIGGTTNKVTVDLTSVWHKLKEGEVAGTKNIEFTLYDYAKNKTVIDLTLGKETPDTVHIKNGRKSTEKGDEIVFTLKPYQQLNLLSTQYLVTSPKEVYYDELIWNSSDPDTVSVKDGVVTAWKNGEAEITVATKNGQSVTVSVKCVGAAVSDTIPISGISLNSTRISLVRGESYELYASYAPYNATNAPDIVWDSYGSPYVKITVDPENPYHCTVFAAKSGSAMVTAKVNGTLFSATCSFGIAEEFEYLGAYLKSYTGKGDENGVVEIPDDKGVTRIYRLAFYNNKDIKKVILPEGVEEIEYAAFYGCENLEEIVLPSTCKQIDEWAFGFCESLRTINLEKVQTICQLAFYADKSLESVDLSSCHTICDRAFSFCKSLKKLDISTVGQIGEFCFVYCTALDELKTSEINKIPDYAFTGCSSLRSLDLYATYVGKNAFAYCQGLTDVIFESDMTEIDETAFYYNSALTNIAFKKTCKYIGGFAFANCASLTSVYVPAGCEYLGDFAFGGCRNVKAVSFHTDANIRSVGRNPFYLVYQVSDFTVEEGSKYLASKDGMLYDKNMTRLILSPFARTIVGLSLADSVTAIGDYALSMVYSIISVNLNNVTEIGEGAFMGAGVQSVYPGSALKTIGDYAFASCGRLTSFAIPEGVETIGDYAFAESGLTGGVRLPESLTALGDYSFASVEDLTSVLVPGSVAEIGEGAFANCTALGEVTLCEGLKTIGEFAFLGDIALQGITLPDSVETLEKGAFALCTGLEGIALPAALTELPEYAFYQATALKNVQIPETVKTIGNFAFTFDKELKTIDLKSVESIGNYAFAGTGITSLSANAVQTVGEYAFAKTLLTSVKLPTATEIGAYAFSETEALTSVELPAAVRIGDGAFARAVKLESASLPAAENVGDAAFAFASELKTLSLPSLKTIGSYAIYNTQVTTMALPATLEEVAPNAFTTKAYSAEGEGLVRFNGFELDSANEKFFLDESGVLYRKLTEKTYLLVAYPSGKTDKAYTVKDGTVRIEAYAFSTNPDLESVTVARTVKQIGAGAFYGCTSLSSISFLSVTAPTLESEYSSASRDGWTYNNFVYDFADENKTLELDVTVPKNGAGYDSYLWANYLGNVNHSDVISMTDGTAALNESIQALPENITLADAATVDRLEMIYNATSGEQRQFVTDYAKLQRAIAKVKELRAAQGGGEDTPQPETPSDPSENNSGEKGLKTGTIVLIVVVSVLAVAGIAVLVRFFVIRRSRSEKSEQNESADKKGDDSDEK